MLMSGEDEKKESFFFFFFFNQVRSCWGMCDVLHSTEKERKKEEYIQQR